MRAIVIEEFLERYEDIYVSDNAAEPTCKQGEVMIKIEAAGLNFVDLLYARGKHQNNRILVTPPFTLGLEFAGTIVSSPSTSKFSLGDRVFGGALGSFAQLISIPESRLQLIPAHWTFEDAAGLAATAPVSYGALITRGQLKAGERILIHSAAGGLGLMAVQIAKAVGAYVIATASTEEKLEVAKRFGADRFISYLSEDWWKEVLDATGGQGVDVVLDPVGLVDRSLKCLKHKGRVLVVGFAGTEGQIEKIAMNRVLLKQAQIIGYRYGESDRRYPEETKEVWKGLMEMVQRGLVKPTVYNRTFYGLESVPAAMKDLAARKVWGKAIISVGKQNKSVM